MRLHRGERDRVPYGKEITRVTKRVLVFVSYTVTSLVNFKR